MSKKMPAEIKCQFCGYQFPFELYRSIWGEYPENRNLVMSDKINVAKCPKCKKSFKLPYAFMYTNAEKQFAVWYEPIHDSAVDIDVNAYKLHMGANSYFATAPRIKDWQEFKDTIIKFENGKLTGQKPTPSKDSAEVFANFINNIPSQTTPNKKLKTCLTIFSIYEIIMLLILSDNSYNGACRSFFTIDFCKAAGIQYFIMCFIIPFSLFLIFVWRKEISAMLKNISSKIEGSDESNIPNKSPIAEAEQRIKFKYNQVGSIIELWEKDVDDDDFIHTGDFDTELMNIPLAKKDMKITTLSRLFKIYFQIKQNKLDNETKLKESEPKSSRWYDDDDD